MATMLERIYAGFLGMNAGIRLGAPVEPAAWDFDRIAQFYGEIRGMSGSIRTSPPMTTSMVPSTSCGVCWTTASIIR